ncbi:MAG: hypothetical protein ACRDX9_17570 [Acidimicrobiia bacterium]
MAEVHRLDEQRREIITDGDRSALRATWHHEAGFVVVSLWRGERCVATSHLTPAEAGRLATFITGGLADLATQRFVATQTVAHVVPRTPISTRVRRRVKALRHGAASSLETLARRLR